MKAQINDPFRHFFRKYSKTVAEIFFVYSHFNWLLFRYAA
jgi:hypothetical protein